MPEERLKATPLVDLGITIIGAGAMGSLLARAWFEQEIRIDAVISRTLHSARELSVKVNANASTELADCPPSTAICLCVPDDRIENLAHHLARTRDDWTGTCVMHTSGALGSGLLRPFAEKGGETMSFHPVTPVTRTSPPDTLRGVVIGIEGSDQGVELGKDLASRVGARPVIIDTDSKVLYHAAAVALSNGLVALHHTGLQMLHEGGVGTEEAQVILRPLLKQTVDNLLNGSPKDALTGPVLRGDADTVDAHIRVIEEKTPGLASLYRELSQRLIAVSREKGELSDRSARELSSVLQRQVDPTHS